MRSRPWPLPARPSSTRSTPVDTFAWFDAEFTVLLYEFKGDIAAYLSGLRFGPRQTRMRTLADLIAFNQAHCTEEMKFFGQEIFESAESLSGNLNDPEYLAARQLCLQLTRDAGIDRVMAENTLDAVLSPSYAFGSSAPAAAGYPIISVPVGLAADGKPAGAWLYAGFLQEPKLIAIAYAMEQLLQPRSPAQFAGNKPPDPPDAGPVSGATSDGTWTGSRRQREGHAPGDGSPDQACAIARDSRSR